MLNRENTVLITQVFARSAELASLRAQINTHFLFSEKTADDIQKLGDMMRFMLQENNRDYIPLDKEVEYLQLHSASSDAHRRNVPHRNPGDDSAA